MKLKAFALCLCFFAFSAHSAGLRDFFKKIKANFKKAPAQSQPVSSEISKERGPAVSSNEDSAPGENQDPSAGEGPIAGFGIKFHRWPNQEESQIIIQYMAGKGLKKTGELSLSKIWIFSWSEGGNKSLISAGSVCSELPEIPSVEICFPDLAIMPSQSAADPQSSLLRGRSQALNDCGIVEKFEHIKSCKPTKSMKCQMKYRHPRSKKTLAGEYWAQNMVGGDLLRDRILRAFPHDMRLQQSAPLNIPPYLLEDRLKKKLI